MQVRGWAIVYLYKWKTTNTKDAYYSATQKKQKKNVLGAHATIYEAVKTTK